MGYFDDPTHRAEWQKELASLAKERENRLSGRHAPAPKSPAVGGLDTDEPAMARPAAGPAAPKPVRAAAGEPHRVPITFEQLQQEAGGRPPEKTRRDPEKQAPEKQRERELEHTKSR